MVFSGLVICVFGRK